jgi:hypothetical protein
MVMMLAADRVLMLRQFFFRYTDPDQSLLWYAAREFAEGRFREPSFPAQSYLSSGEALLAAPLIRAGIQPYYALPIVSVLLVTIPWVLLLIAAWRRRAWLAGLLVAALPLALPNEYLMLSGIPHGMTPGIVVAALAAFLALTGTGPGRLFVVGLLCSLAFGLNQTSALLTVPLLAHVVLRRKAGLAWLTVGLAVGSVYPLLTRYFYSTHPAYRFHPDPVFTYSFEDLLTAITHIGRYLDHLGFWFLKAPIVAILALAIPAAMLIASRRHSYALPATLALVLPLASFGLHKAADGSYSVFFAYTRLYIALPLLAALLILLAQDVIPLKWGNKATLAALLITALAAGSFAGRSLVMERDIRQAVAVNDAFPIIAADRLPRVLEECRTIFRLVDSYAADLVVYAVNSTLPYACGTLAYGTFATLNPAYERRSWRLLEERGKLRSRMMIVEAGDRLCRVGAKHLSRCERISTSYPSVVIAEFHRQAVTQLLPRIGIAVRRF